MKERFLWIGITLIVLSTIGNYIFFHSKQLNDPIFFNHYYTEEIFEEGQNISLTFYYLTNKQHPQTVQYVEVGGVTGYPYDEEETMFWDDNDSQIQFTQEFNHQYIVPVTIEFPIDSIPLEKDTNDTWTFEKMNVFFSDNEEMEVPIGKVQIKRGPQSSDVFEFTSASASDYGKSTTSINVLKSLKVDAISIPFPDDIGEELDVNVNTSAAADETDNNQSQTADDLFPLSLEPNDTLRVQTTFSTDNTAFMDIGITIKGTTDDGEDFAKLVYINDQPYFTQAEITDFIARKKAGESN